MSVYNFHQSNTGFDNLPWKSEKFSYVLKVASTRANVESCSGMHMG